MNLQQLADAAGQVIDGVVVSTASAWNADQTAMTTTVRFDQVQYLKGPLLASDGVFELVVPGGTIGDAHIELAGAPQFEVGQRWLLFLHPTYRVYPVVGIHRGAFRIEDGVGGQIIYDPTGAPVAAVDDRGYVMVGSSSEARTATRGCVLQGVSGGVIEVKTPTQARFAPLKYVDFLERLKPILESSRAFDLVQPAGQRKIQPVTPTTLRIRNLDEAAQTARHRERTPSLGHDHQVLKDARDNE